MKFPSIQKLAGELKKVLKRFPLETFFAFAASCAATALIEFEQNNLEYSNWCWRVIMASNLGLLLCLSASLFSGSRASAKHKPPLYILAFLAGLAFLFVFNPMRRESDIARFFMVSFGFHLLVAFCAFIGKADYINAFWQFNKTLFLRFLTGALYSGVLYIGLSAAVGAMNFLFNFNFEWDTFAIMGVWIAGMFQTVFFLSGVPENTRSLQSDVSYPSGLKLFTQYVLIPLASVYFLILISYELKILLSWNMPKGLVSSLILGYAVFGILSLLLVYPLRNTDGHKWINTFSKSFYFLLIPLLVLLFLAIYARVDHYGITEGRYILIALALWLTFITAYFIISKRQNIILIPVSLCIVTLLGVYGPLSAFNITEKSQLAELREVLEKNKALTNGKLNAIDIKLDSADTERVRDVSRYMVSKYGLRSLQPLVKEDLEKVGDSIKTSINKKKLGRSRYNKWEQSEAEHKWLYKNYKLPIEYAYNFYKENFYVVAENNELVPVSGADFITELSFFHDPAFSTKLDDNKELFYGVRDAVLTVRIQKDSVRINLKDFIDRIHKEGLKSDKIPKDKNETIGAQVLYEDAFVLPRSILTEKFDLNGYQFTVLFNRIQYTKATKAYSIESLDGVFLLKKIER